MAIVPVEEADDPRWPRRRSAPLPPSGGLRVLLVEAGAPTPAVAGLPGVPRHPGLVDYLDGRAAPREVLRSLLVASRRGRALAARLRATAGTAASSEPDDLAGARLRGARRAAAARLRPGPRCSNLPLAAVRERRRARPSSRPRDGVVLVSASEPDPAVRRGRGRRPPASVPVLGARSDRRMRGDEGVEIGARASDPAERSATGERAQRVPYHRRRWRVQAHARERSVGSRGPRGCSRRWRWSLVADRGGGRGHRLAGDRRRWRRSAAGDDEATAGDGDGRRGGDAEGSTSSSRATR